MYIQSNQNFSVVEPLASSPVGWMLVGPVTVAERQCSKTMYLLPKEINNKNHDTAVAPPLAPSLLVPLIHLYPNP